MAKIQLLSGVFEDGRQIRGGCFLGPIGGEQTAANGSLESSFRDTIIAELDDLAQVLSAATTPLSIYRRPREAAPGVTPRPGRVVPVTSVSASALPASLRSRRD
jgi:hypothetical protein